VEEKFPSKADMAKIDDPDFQPPRKKNAPKIEDHKEGS